MAARTIAAGAVALAALAVPAGLARPPAPAVCAPRTLTAAYTSSVRAAVASPHDLWGEQLLRAPGGPTYAAAKAFLPPLGRAAQWHAQPLTASGAYYLPLSFPFSSHGSTVYALHVADGSAIVTRRVGGPSLTIAVGAGDERYGSCASRLVPARLADGSLPILRTAYTDANGVRYRQESFVGRALGARSVVSFVRLDVDATHAQGASTVRFVPSMRLARVAPARLGEGSNARLIVGRGANLVRGAMEFSVRAGTTRTVYGEWLHAPSPARYLHATAAAYDGARAAVVRFWRARLSAGATFQVPEAPVQDAERAVLAQVIAYGWRYSIGNPYEELSYAESLDAAEVAAQYGYADVARSIIELSLHRMHVRPWRFTAFRGAHILATAALYVRLTNDRAFLRRATPALDALVARIAARQLPNGRLHPEPLSTDLEDEDVNSVPGQIEAVVGLRAIARVWQAVGDDAPATQARRLASSIDAAFRPAVARASTRLPDGSLFVPAQLTRPQRPFGLLTASRASSYWNLVMPYAFASGWFSPSAERGILRYLDTHGSQLLGVPRTYARTVYGRRVAGSGLAPVYGLGGARFLADNDRPGRLDLSLYGLLAAGMTAGTFVSGEAVSVLPVGGAYERTMFMPPNTGTNASFLGTLRELLVHERRNPAGLDLAFASPRAWLAPGKRIAVERAPTSFGDVSFTIVRRGDRIEARLVLPAGALTRLRLRVPAGERLRRVVVGSVAVPVDAAGTVDLGRRGGAVVVRAAVTGLTHRPPGS